MNITNCKRCGSENLVFSKTPNLIHYGKMVCGHCTTFSNWISNPSSPRKDSLRINQKTIAKIMVFHGITNEEFCFMCLRERKQLGEKETLTIDHIKELSKGGIDQITNMQVLCSACHKIKNWLRLYLNWHLNGEEIDGGEQG